MPLTIRTTRVISSETKLVSIKASAASTEDSAGLASRKLGLLLLGLLSLKEFLNLLRIRNRRARFGDRYCRRGTGIAHALGDTIVFQSLGHIPREIAVPGAACAEYWDLEGLLVMDKKLGTLNAYVASSFTVRYDHVIAALVALNVRTVFLTIAKPSRVLAHTRGPQRWVALGVDEHGHYASNTVHTPPDFSVHAALAVVRNHDCFEVTLEQGHCWNGLHGVMLIPAGTLLAADEHTGFLGDPAGRIKPMEQCRSTVKASEIARDVRGGAIEAETLYIPSNWAFAFIWLPLFALQPYVLHGVANDRDAGEARGVWPVLRGLYSGVEHLSHHLIYDSCVFLNAGARAA